MYSYETYLMHHGIKGQKWGVRRYQNPDGSLTPAGKKRLNRTDRKYDKLAKKDAKEFARAKMFYGEGAGNRRKLIKNTVEQRRKDNAHYSEAFDKYLSEQDMADHAEKAKKERAIRSTKNSVTKTGRGLINASMGNIGRASASAAAIYTVAHVTGIDQQISSFMQEKIRNIKI